MRDTRGERFAMTIDKHAYSQRGDAARALARCLQAITLGPARPVAKLAGAQIDAELRGEHHGEQYLHLTLHGLPAQPATLKRSQLAEAGLSLIRQLEHRVHTLPDLAARLDTERADAVREAGAARDQLASPFKYADHLTAARQEQQRIHQLIAERHHERQHAEHVAARAAADVDVDAAASTAPAEDPGLDPQTAESLRLLRATQAAPMTDAPRSPPAASPSARTPLRSPSRSSRGRR